MVCGLGLTSYIRAHLDQFSTVAKIGPLATNEIVCSAIAVLFLHKILDTQNDDNPVARIGGDLVVILVIRGNEMYRNSVTQNGDNLVA